jgi:hypothetical protein
MVSTVQPYGSNNNKNESSTFISAERKLCTGIDCLRNEIMPEHFGLVIVNTCTHINY